MGLLNHVLTAGADLMLRPLEWLPPIFALAVVSLVSAVGILLVVRRLSDARRIDAAKRGMQAGILEMRLFNDDLGALARAQLDVLRWTGSYVRGSAAPMLMLVVPLALVTSQLDAFFGYRGFSANQSVLVSARVRADVSDATARSASIAADDRIQIETPAVWIPGTRELLWRIRPLANGEDSLRLTVAGVPIDKTLSVSERWGRRSPVRPSSGAFGQMRYPSERPLSPDSPVMSIALDYPERELSVLGWRASWLAFYMVFTLLMALGLRRTLRASL